METVNEIKERLSAKSRTATLDELRNEGRKQVRLIRAEHIAAMVSQAVHAAIEDSGLIDPAEHEQLVEKSREEFKEILNERQEEARHAREVEERLEEREREIREFRDRVEELTESLAEARSELEAATSGSDGARSELEEARASLAALESEVRQARADAEQARAEAEQARAEAEQARREAQAQAAQPAAPAASNELLMSLFHEMATMKASMQQPNQAAAGQGASGGPDLSAALDKLTSSLNDRLESFGKKMGISAAVESDAPTDFSGLFKDTGENLESNMDNVKLKQKAGGGIAANLARLKKLKGGGGAD